MIWSVVTKNEMENYKIPPVFHHYREALGKDNIKLSVVDENDSLDFVGSNDTVLLRSASKQLIDTIQRKKIVSTAENYDVYEEVKDKASLAISLKMHGIEVPKQSTIDEMKEGKTYFVKPRFGSESFGITDKNICRTKEEVKVQINRIEKELCQEAIIEEFIEGIDCTVACFRYHPNNKVLTSAIEIECSEVGGIQTHYSKFEYSECCSSLKGDVCNEINNICTETFNLLDIKHHARIDFRKSTDGKLYLIDVNLIPGLGPLAHLPKCLLLVNNISYIDAIKSVVNSATQ